MHQESSNLLCCACCGYRTIRETGEGCRICHWINDPYQAVHTDTVGQNNISLSDAQDNFDVYGVCEKRFAKDMQVFPDLIESGVQEGDIRDPSWKPLRLIQAIDLQLVSVAAKTDVSTISALISAGANVNFQSYHGITALFQATMNKDHPEIIDFLIEAGADLQESNRIAERSLLENALYFSNIEAVKRLISHGLKARVDSMEVQIAAVFEDTLPIRLILEAGGEPNAKNASGRTALHGAALNGLINTVRILLQAGADPEITDDCGLTAGLLAASCGEYEIVEALNGKVDPESELAEILLNGLLRNGDMENFCNLIQSGTRPTYVDGAGKDPLIIAVECGNLEALEMILAAGASIDPADPKRESALLIAIDKGKISVAERLLELGADPNRKDSVGNTPLRAAIHAADPQLTRALINSGADVHWRSDRETLLGLALKISHEPSRRDILKIFLESGSDVDAWWHDGGYWGSVNPLMYSVITQDLSIIDLLVSYGADLNAANANEKTALMWAAENGREDVALYLLSQGAPKSQRDIHHKCAADYALENGYAELAEKITEWQNVPRRLN